MGWSLVDESRPSLQLCPRTGGEPVRNVTCGLLATLERPIDKTSPAICPVGAGEEDIAMRLLQLLRVLGHATAAPAAPSPLGQRVIHPVMRKVGLNVPGGAQVAAELGNDGFVVPRVFQVPGIPEANAVGAVWARRLVAVVVGKGEAEGRVAVAVAGGEPAGLDVVQLEMDLGALVDVARCNGLAFPRAERRSELDVAQAIQGDGGDDGFAGQGPLPVHGFDHGGPRSLIRDNLGDHRVQQDVAPCILQHRDGEAGHAALAQLVDAGQFKDLGHAVPT